MKFKEGDLVVLRKFCNFHFITPKKEYKVIKSRYQKDFFTEELIEVIELLDDSGQHGAYYCQYFKLSYKSRFNNKLNKLLG